MTHRWTAPTRPDLHTSYRSCTKCALVKITRHEPDNTPRHWVEFERDGRKVETVRTPACEVA